MKEKLKSYGRTLIFIIAGMAIGFIYYKLFGCTGSCRITSNPFISMAYMGVIGGLISQVFETGPKDKEKL